MSPLRTVGAAWVAGVCSVSACAMDLDAATLATIDALAFRKSRRLVAMEPPGSQPERREPGVIVRPPSERPVKLALVRGDRQVVDAGDAETHQPLVVELPVLVAVGSEVLAAVVVPFVGEPHGDAIAGERPELLDQAVVQLAVPFPREELDDGRAAL